MSHAPWTLAACALCAFVTAIAPVSLAAPTLGFRETWNAGTEESWGGGLTIVISNPGSGGLANSGFLRLNGDPPDLHHLGTRTFGTEYVGAWTAAGISQVRVWLSDLGTDDPHEIHFSLGRFQSLYQYDIGFVPPVDGWAEYVIDLTNEANFTRIIATAAGTFAEVLEDVEVVHIRHDLAPFMKTPDTVNGDFGIDNLLLTDGTVAVPLPVAGVHRPVQLAPPSPNPSHGSVSLAVSSGTATDVTIRIVDATGRRVREQRLDGVSGTRTWTWDGRDSGGRRVGAGVYRAIASSPLGGTSRSLVLVD